MRNRELIAVIVVLGVVAGFSIGMLSIGILIKVCLAVAIATFLAFLCTSMLRSSRVDFERVGNAGSGALIAQLRDRSAAATAKFAREAAAQRRKEAMTVIGQVKAKCKEASDHGAHEALICHFETPARIGFDDLEALDNWVTDVSRYCLSLGLVLRVDGYESKRYYGHSFLGDFDDGYSIFCAALYASWGTGSN
ncbi:MAG TPA: hypothetical protein V6D22_00775 [Candidatus Obscuribacterales bacterium]